MIHFVTPLYRKNYLEIIYSSIINQIDDFNWHLIEGTNVIGCEDFGFLTTDPRIKTYKMQTQYIWGHEQRNHFINEIKCSDEDFCYFLDDDNIITHDMVEIYQREKNSSVDLILFSQKAGLTNKTRLYANSLDDLDLGRCDIGSFLVRYNLLKKVYISYLESRNSDGHLACSIKTHINEHKMIVEGGKYTRYNALSLNIF